MRDDQTGAVAAQADTHLAHGGGESRPSREAEFDQRRAHTCQKVTVARAHDQCRMSYGSFVETPWFGCGCCLIVHHGRTKQKNI